jgi:tyrosine-protein kinase Etk/Wzc
MLPDTLPVLAVTDATMLSEQMGTNILVAREGITMLGELNETVKRFTQTGAKVTGVVFNVVRPRPGKYGYGYGKYRYSSDAHEQYAKRP